jgi:multidrug efflux pump subunit AcrB
VEAAIAAQNLIIPAGTAKVGQFEYDVRLNDSPEAFEDLNNIPIRTLNGATTYIRDVAYVRDGSPPQTNVVRVDGARSVLMTVLKSGSASTLAIVSRRPCRHP